MSETSPDVVGLGDFELHVWTANLAGCEPVSAEAAAMLAPDERARADRLALTVERRRFVLARAALRRVLGGYLCMESSAVSLGVGAHGKPYLTMRHALHFNLSHTADLAVIAVCRRHPVGVDVEQMGRGLDELGDIARTYFSIREQAAYFALPRTKRAAAFYRGWTRKEAVAKALGLGMSLPGPSFDVSLGAGEPQLLRLGGDVQPARWSLIDLDLGQSHVGALAAPTTGLSLILRRLDDPQAR